VRRLSWFLLAVFLLVQAIPSAPALGQAATAALPGQNVVCKTSGKTQICASVSNKAPAQYTYVTVYGSLKVNGVMQKSKTMIAVGHYKTTTPSCQGLTSSTGVGSCKRGISRATKGYRVQVVVTINGYTVTTWFTPG
jgi:hypothetical protein